MSHKIDATGSVSAKLLGIMFMGCCASLAVGAMQPAVAQAECSNAMLNDGRRAYCNLIAGSSFANPGRALANGAGTPTTANASAGAFDPSPADSQDSTATRWADKNIAYLRSGSAGTVSLSQALSPVPRNNATYRRSVLVGRRTFTPRSNHALQLRSGSTIFASASNLAVANNSSGMDWASYSSNANNPIVSEAFFYNISLESMAEAPLAASLCDANGDGKTTVADVQLVINESLGVELSVNDLNSDGWVNVVDIQIVLNAVLNLGCSADTGPVGVPLITSITPTSGNIGQTVTGVVVQGTNLAGATFSLLGGGTVTPVEVGSTEATVTITVGQTPGPFVLVATGSSGPSTSQYVAGNTFVVFNAPGNNYSDMLFSVFNAAGPTPNYPPGSNEVDQVFSVFDPIVTPGTATLIPVGSNQAWQLFSTNNQTGTTPAAIAVSVAQAARRVDLDTGSGELLPGSRPPLNLIAGQTVELTVQSSLFLHYLEIEADGAPLASSTGGSMILPLTAPFGLDSFTLRTFGYATFGSANESPTETIRVVADPGRTIVGQVTDASGSPVPGAVVTWLAQGLAAEYYRFGGELRTIPDLRGGSARLSFLGALNYPNPQQVFGADPMGVNLGKYYAARLRGKIRLDTAGIYQFGLRAHSGARLTIDGQLVAEAEATGADAALAMGSANLTAGAHEIEVTHFESGGAAVLQLLWTPPGGEQTVVPPEAITSEAPTFWRAVTGSDGRFVLHVPAALDGVVVNLAAGLGSVQVDR